MLDIETLQHGDSSYLYLYWPSKVADIYKECDVWIVAKVKLLIGETVLELLDVTPRHNGDLFSSLGSRWVRGQMGREKQIEMVRMEREKIKLREKRLIHEGEGMVHF